MLRDLLSTQGVRQTALAAGVVDELSLLVIPELLGHNTWLVEGHALRRKLELVETRVMDTGAMPTRYRLVREPGGPWRADPITAFLLQRRLISHVCAAGGDNPK